MREPVFRLQIRALLKLYLEWKDVSRYPHEPSGLICRLPRAKESDGIWEDIDIVRVFRQAHSVSVNHACHPHGVEVVDGDVAGAAAFDAEDALLAILAVDLGGACCINLVLAIRCFHLEATALRHSDRETHS